MIKEYFHREEMQKLQKELWNLIMKEANVPVYTNRFSDLATLCPRMVALEYQKIERYIWGLPHPIQGLFTTFKPKFFDSAM